MTECKEKSPWGLILVLFSAGILSAFQVGKMPPVLTDIRLDLDINLVFAGWLLSIFNLTGLLLGTFTGAFADTIGHRRLLLTGLGLQVAGSLAGSVSASFYALLFTRILEGTGFLSVAISTPTLIFQVAHSKDARFALSVWSCYLPLGGALMMVLLPLILTATDWRGLWQINAVLLALYALLLAKKTSHIQFSNPSSNGFQLKKIVKDMIKTATCPGPVLLSLCFIAYAMQWLAVMGFLPTMLIEKFNVSAPMASVLTGIMVFVNIFGNLIGGWMLNRGYPRWQLMAIASIIMGTCAFAIYGTSFNFIINYAGCIIFSTCSGLIPAAVLSGAPLYAPTPHTVATTNGFIIQGGQSGQFLGPPIMAFLVSQTGTWACGAWFLCSTALLGLMFSLVLSKIGPAKPL